ncbi:MAG TPA: DUF1934 domain-containing protein [Chondromyces sp.]|nr:DUF1934 domain-containing protein [Chondromyces sp.]
MAAEATNYTPVKIHLKTTVEHDGERETFELSLFGKYYEKKDAIFLKYDEVQEEGTVHTIVKLSPEGALILRSGAVKMRMVFQYKEQLSGSYESPYGTLLLTTDTRNLSCRTYKGQQLEGNLQLTYQLLMQGSSAGIYSMAIQFKEEREA